MRSQLAGHFLRVRIQRKLALGQLARMVGYKNVPKGSNRILRFEQSGEIHDELLRKLAVALRVDTATVSELIEQDRREFVQAWNDWADVPIRPHIVVRWLAAVYARRELPGGTESVQEAEAYAAETARCSRKKVCLKLSRRCSIWFDENGEITGRTESVPGAMSIPQMRLKGSRRGLLLEHPETGRTVLRMIDWPGNPMTTPDETGSTIHME